MAKEDILHHFQDINFYYNDCMMYDDLSRMLDELIDENKGEWIPVTERLPEVGQRVLVTIEYMDEGLTVRETIFDKYGFMCGNATAWQPLPEPYKAESEG